MDDDDDYDDLTYLQTRLKHYRVLAVATSFPIHNDEKFEVSTQVLIEIQVF
jgi:hypothetical protein